MVERLGESDTNQGKEQTVHSTRPFGGLTQEVFVGEGGYTMTKSEMVKKLAETWGGLSNRQANDQLDQLVDFITKTVKKDKELKIPNLGTFRLRQLKARTGRNPQTGEPIKIPARKKVGFSAAKVFKESILGAAKK